MRFTFTIFIAVLGTSNIAFADDSSADCVSKIDPKLYVPQNCTITGSTLSKDILAICSDPVCTNAEHLLNSEYLKCGGGGNSIAQLNDFACLRDTRNVDQSSWNQLISAKDALHSDQMKVYAVYAAALQNGGDVFEAMYPTKEDWMKGPGSVYDQQISNDQATVNVAEYLIDSQSFDCVQYGNHAVEHAIDDCSVKSCCMIELYQRGNSKDSEQDKQNNIAKYEANCGVSRSQCKMISPDVSTL
jgi:hypothetical protein